MPRTAKELSPEELKQYRLRLNQHFQNRDPVDEALLCRAWQIACQVAVMLYENFGATQVAVFGSLAERVKTIFPRISAELDIFITWLEQQGSD